MAVARTVSDYRARDVARNLKKLKTLRAQLRAKITEPIPPNHSEARRSWEIESLTATLMTVKYRLLLLGHDCNSEESPEPAPPVFFERRKPFVVKGTFGEIGRQ